MRLRSASEHTEAVKMSRHVPINTATGSTKDVIEKDTLLGHTCMVLATYPVKMNCTVFMSVGECIYSATLRQCQTDGCDVCPYNIN